MGRDIFGAIRNQRPSDVPYLDNGGNWSVEGHPFQLYKDGTVGIPTGKVLIGETGILAGTAASTLVLATTKAISWVMADLGLNVTGSVSDSGALRAVISQSDAGGASSIRAIESHAIRTAAAGAGGTYAHEFGVHSAKAGNGANLTGGLYVASSEAGWLTAATGMRADVGILITGDLGFTYPIRAVDTDGLTARFSLNQYGNIFISPPSNTSAIYTATAAGSGLAGVVAATAGASNSILTNAAGDLLVSADGVAGGVISMVHAGALANSILIGAGGAIRMAKYGAGTATFDGSGNVTSVSDERKKDILGPFDGGLDEVLAIEPIRYQWKQDSGLNPDDLNVGFSAQQVKDVIPEAVGQDAQGFYTFHDRPVIAALVNAVKELKAEVDELRAMVAV